LFTERMHRVVQVLERVLIVLLLVMAALAIVEVGFELYAAATGPGFLPPDAVLSVLDAVLVVFIIIELVNTAFAYIERKNIVGTVLEAGLVAVVRKLIVFDTDATASYVIMKGAGLAVLILAIGVTWYLLRRSGTAPAQPTE
jgi:uncharacterized membrane protein (DUF373 family)